MGRNTHSDKYSIILRCDLCHATLTIRANRHLRTVFASHCCIPQSPRDKLREGLAVDLAQTILNESKFNA